jgi:endonuclease YncB( thermonuclease family)
MKKIILFLLFLVCQNEVIENDLKVIDGDTININGEKIRFFGIDAPEIDQECIKNGKTIKCGVMAKKALEAVISRNVPICEKKGLDKYKRIIAECFVNNYSLSKYLVLNGYAFAYKKYSKKFIYSEKRAKILKKGLWSMKFEYPWKFRKKKKK